jgi:hypothetical protein
MNLAIILLSLLPSIALAQKPATTAAKTMKINFEDELVQGSQKKPDIEALTTPGGQKFGKLIKLRQNFLVEMEEAAPNSR